MSINAKYSGDPVRDASDHLRRLEALPVATIKCDLCGNYAPEDCITMVVCTRERICQGCLNTLTIEKVREMSPDDPQGVKKIIKQLFTENK